MIGMYVSSKSLTLVATYCHMSIRVYGLLYAAALSWVHILASCRSYRDLWPVASSWCPWFQCSWAVAANSTCTRKRGKTISLFPLLLLLICFLTNTQPSTVRKVLLDASHFKWIACVFLFLLQHQNCCISQKEAPERFVAHHTLSSTPVKDLKRILRAILLLQIVYSMQIVIKVSFGYRALTIRQFQDGKYDYSISSPF